MSSLVYNRLYAKGPYPRLLETNMVTVGIIGDWAALLYSSSLCCVFNGGLHKHVRKGAIFTYN